MLYLFSLLSLVFLKCLSLPCLSFMDFKGGIVAVVYGDCLLEVFFKVLVFVFCHLFQFAEVSVVEYCSDFILFEFFFVYAFFEFDFNFFDSAFDYV